MSFTLANGAPQKEAARFVVHRQGIAHEQLHIGPYTYHGHDLQLKVWAPGEKIVIGGFCSISDGVTIHVGGGHGAELTSTYPFDFFLLNRSKPHRTYRTTPHTVIGSDVWIGGRATILAGVQIGHGAIIGNSAVVTHDVPPYGIVAGNPARLIRTRFAPEVIAALLRICWWDWPIETIRQRVEWFYRPIEDFINEFDPRRGTPSPDPAIPTGATLAPHVFAGLPSTTAGLTTPPV